MAQNKMPKSVAEKIVMTTSLKFMVQTPHCNSKQKTFRRLLGGEFQFLHYSGKAQGDLITASAFWRCVAAAWRVPENVNRLTRPCC